MIARRTVQLTVRSRDNVDRLAELVWESGTIQIRHATENLRTAITRWMQHGLTDTTGTRMDPELRHTQSDDPRFLEHLDDYLKRSSGFITHLEIHQHPALGWLLSVKPSAQPPRSQWAAEIYRTKDRRLQSWTMRTLALAKRALGPAHG
jgi:hypothetical protein